MIEPEIDYTQFLLAYRSAQSRKIDYIYITRQSMIDEPCLNVIFAQIDAHPPIHQLTDQPTLTLSKYNSRWRDSIIIWVNIKGWPPTMIGFHIYSIFISCELYT